MEELKNRVAIVTGSTSGIGRAVAAELARQGAKVCVSGRERARGEQVVAEIAAAGGEALFVQADLTEPETPAEIVRRTAARWGRIDIVVNNAAVPCNKPIEAIGHADWDLLFAVNVKAAFFVVQAALPWLTETKGVVLNVSSIVGMINDRNNVVYDTMKAALNHMTRGLALDLRDMGVRVNAILPGGGATPMLMSWFEQQSASPADALAAYEASLREEMVTEPGRIADAIALLLSDRASWINGAAIPADGGKFLG